MQWDLRPEGVPGQGSKAQSLTRVPGRLISGTAEGLKVQTERTRSMLLFANVSARHYGNYTCRAANRLGASSASMRLLRESEREGRGRGEGAGIGGRAGPGSARGGAGTVPQTDCQLRKEVDPETQARRLSKKPIPSMNVDSLSAH